MTVLSQKGDAAAMLLFKRATELDPRFAMAFARYGLGFNAIGESGHAAEAFKQAMKLEDRATDDEKFFVDSDYDLHVTGNLERAERTAEVSGSRPIRANGMCNGFLSAMVYSVLGNYPKALDEAKKLVERDPDFSIGYLQLAFNSNSLGLFAASDEALRRAAERKLDTPEFAVQRYGNAFLKGDKAAMAREVALGAGKPVTEDWLAYQEGLTFAYSGQLAKARSKVQHAVDISKGAGEQERAAILQSGEAVWEAFFEDKAHAIRSAKAALALSKGRDTEYGAAFALALSGDSAEAGKIADNLQARFP